VVKRRAFLVAGVAGVAALAASRRARAQPPAKPHRIGILWDLPTSESFRRFEQRLVDLGYVIGPNFAIDRRQAEGRIDRLPALAAARPTPRPEA
jgi:hypothetical protein